MDRELAKLGRDLGLSSVQPVRRIFVPGVDPELWPHHRSGWRYAALQLSKLHDRAAPTTLLHCLDELALRPGECRDDEAITARAAEHGWIGFLHAAASPFAEDDRASSVESVLAAPTFRRLEPTCRGIFCLSSRSADVTRSLCRAPVDWIRLPTAPPRSYFTWGRFLENPDRKLIMIGYRHRDLRHIYELDPNRVALRKCLLAPRPDPALLELDARRGGVDLFGWQDAPAYDRLLTESVVFLPLNDVSGCNTLVECIVRHTPVLLPKLPAAVDYLGSDYPLFYEDLEDAAKRVADENQIRAAHLHLARSDPMALSGDRFLKTLTETSIYRSLLS
jgi:hypothetical protein